MPVWSSAPPDPPRRARLDRSVRWLAESLVLALQLEAETVAVGLQAGILQRILKDAGVALKEVEGVGAIGRDDGGDAAISAHVKTDFDTPQFRRLELDADPVAAFSEGFLNLDSHLVDDEARRNRRRRFGGLRGIGAARAELRRSRSVAGERERFRAHRGCLLPGRVGAVAGPGLHGRKILLLGLKGRDRLRLGGR